MVNKISTFISSRYSPFDFRLLYAARFRISQKNSIFRFSNFWLRGILRFLVHEDFQDCFSKLSAPSMSNMHNGAESISVTRINKRHSGSFEGKSSKRRSSVEVNFITVELILL